MQQPCLANDVLQLQGMFGTLINKLDTRGDKEDAEKTRLYDSIEKFAVQVTDHVVNTKDNFQAVNGNFQKFDKVLGIVATRIADNKAEADAKIADNKAEADAIMAENKAETDAIMAENKAETDAKMAEIVASADAKMADNKAETDAKIAEIMNALSKVASGSATGCVPDATAKLPMRKNQRYTAESKRITLQWLMKNTSNPYADRDEMKFLQQKTGVNTFPRMRSLITQIRTKEMVKDKNGKWCKRTTTKPSVVGNKRSWTQKSISDCM